MKNDICYFDLIPQSKKMLLGNPNIRLLQVSLFCNVLQDVILSLKSFFIEKSLKYFDPHVGDTLCQIRAVLLLAISHESNINIKSLIKELFPSE